MTATLPSRGRCEPEIEIGNNSLSTPSSNGPNTDSVGEQPSEAEPRTPTCRLVRNEAALITEVEESIVEILGWRPDQVLDSPPTALVHPDDLARAVAAWFSMIDAPGSTQTWRGRFRTADGGWCWIEAQNTNRLDDPDDPGIFTVIRRCEADSLDLEEELRAREELIARLTDALPVGVFQVDRDRRMLFTNGRLHHILGTPPVPDMASQFSAVADHDLRQLNEAVDTALAGREVDALELHLGVVVPHRDFASIRVCEVSLRPLTNRAGSVSGVIGTLSDVTESVDLRRELELRASTDTLTGCLNRAAIFDLLDLALRASCGSKVGVAAVFVDLDRFKEINDRLGHAAGDRALLSAAERMGGAIRTGDALGRIGGDEFVVVCPTSPSPEAAALVARRISESLRAPASHGADQIQLSASIGVAWTDRHDESSDALIARADSAMYQSKLEASGEVVLAGR
jgi:diguanylate cyclase (GGDEF)-like protein/PAS domain S-box-containing protein